MVTSQILVYSVLISGCSAQYNDRRGHRGLRLTSRKHFKPKPKTPTCLHVSIARQHVSVLKESLPLNLVNLKVSVPLSSFLDGPVPTLSKLYSRLQAANRIPQGKMMISIYLRYYFSFD